MELYGIFDSVAEEYIGFFNAKNNEVAKRGLSGLEKTDPRVSDDFILIRLGEFDGLDFSYNAETIGTILSIVGAADNE